MSAIDGPTPPRRDRMAVAAFLVLMATALTAEAQDCRGVPSQRLHVMASRLELNDGTPSYTGELGVRSGMNGINLNYSTADVGNAGSATRSSGIRLFRQRGNDWIAFCALIGYQVGYTYLIDVEGSVMNYRETTRIVPVALPLAVRKRLLPGLEVGAFVSPQYLFQSSVGQLYDRGDTIAVNERPSVFATEMGITARFTVLFVRIARFKRSDRDADVTIGGGFAW